MLSRKTLAAIALALLVWSAARAVLRGAWPDRVSYSPTPDDPASQIVDAAGGIQP